MGFPRQEFCNGLPFPTPENLPDPGIEHRSPALQADSWPSEPPGNDRLLKETATKINVLQRIIVSSRVFKTNMHNVQDTIQNSHNAKIKHDRDFPGSTVGKSLPAKVGGMRVRSWLGMIPHAREQLKTHAPQPLSSSSRAHRSQLVSSHAAATEAHVPRACAPQQEKPLQREAQAPQRRVVPTPCN